VQKSRSSKRLKAETEPMINFQASPGRKWYMPRPLRWNEKQYQIYALIDPIDGLALYVGKSEDASMLDAVGA
jgi:hypothetical protein